MNITKRKKLEQAGWVVGSASDFLELSKEEEAIVEMKLALASKLKDLRKKQSITQQDLANLMGSSQSRIAKMEAADESVSMELLVRSLVALGSTPRQIGMVIGGWGNSSSTAHVSKEVAVG